MKEIVYFLHLFRAHILNLEFIWIQSENFFFFKLFISYLNMQISNINGQSGTLPYAILNRCKKTNIILYELHNKYSN